MAIEGVGVAVAVVVADFPHAAAEWAAGAADSLLADAAAGEADPAAEAAAAAWAAARKSSSNRIVTRACSFRAAKRTPCSPGSVADPDPPKTQFFWASRIRLWIRILLFYHHAKIVRKNLVKGMDLLVRIHTKMSWFRNTVIRNMVLGDSVYGEKRISVEDEGTAGKLEYRVWNPFRSKLAAAILGGVDKIHMPPGSKVRISLWTVVNVF